MVSFVPGRRVVEQHEQSPGSLSCCGAKPRFALGQIPFIRIFYFDESRQGASRMNNSVALWMPPPLQIPTCRRFAVSPRSPIVC